MPIRVLTLLVELGSVSQRSATHITRRLALQSKNFYKGNYFYKGN